MRGMARVVVVLVVVATALLGWASPAGAGVIVFNSARCESAADLEKRPQRGGPPGVPRVCVPAIWTVDDDGSGLQRIPTTPAGDSEDLGATWSPLGTALAFSRIESPRNGWPDDGSVEPGGL